MKEYTRRAQEAYNERERKKGTKIVKVRVPTADDAQAIREIAKSMRDKHNDRTIKRLD